MWHNNYSHHHRASGKDNCGSLNPQTSDKKENITILIVDLRTTKLDER